MLDICFQREIVDKINDFFESDKILLSLKVMETLIAERKVNGYFFRYSTLAVAAKSEYIQHCLK